VRHQCPAKEKIENYFGKLLHECKYLIKMYSKHRLCNMSFRAKQILLNLKSHAHLLCIHIL
jgi:hypothetical protein